MPKKYVVDGAKLKCSLGMKPGTLIIPPPRKEKLTGKRIANVMDCKPLNIPPGTFAACKVTSPPKPCSPVCIMWTGEKSNVFIEQYKALIDSSIVACAAGGGKIEITDSGQGIPSIKALISRAVSAQKTAAEFAKKLGFDKLSPPKVIASDGPKTLSGWTGDYDGLERTMGKGGPNLTDVVLALANKKEFEYTLRKSGAADCGVDGRALATHAEKQLAMITDEPIGISKDMCKDCQRFFIALAKLEGDIRGPIVTADPSCVRVFYASGIVEIYDHDGQLYDDGLENGG